MRDLSSHQAVALFQLLDHAELVLHALAELVYTLREHGHLIASADRDLPRQVAALQYLDLIVDHVNIIHFLLDPGDHNAHKYDD